MMNQLGYSAFRPSWAGPTIGGSFSASFSGQVNVGVGLQGLLGASTPLPQFSSSLMQQMFGGSSFGSNPLMQLFQQMSQGGSIMGQYGAPHHSPRWGGHFGGAAYGGYGCSAQHCCPPPPQNCYTSPCQSFDFGHHCPPGCRDIGHQFGGYQGGSTGQLQQEAEGKPINYTTSGGYKVSIDGHTINITDPNGKNTMKTWGDPHENVNGKHVSDWQEKQRTIVLDDGTKITMAADNPKGVVESMSIYDGNQSVQIDNTKNKVTDHTYNPFQTRSAELNQYDGSVAYLQTGGDGSLNFANYYTQDENFGITRNYQLLATVDSAGTVTDHFDDPTHKNT